MNNFLHNLARRSAGLPLSTEFFATPSPVLKTGFHLGEGFKEITPEETATVDQQTALLEQIDVVPRSTQEVQRAPMESGPPSLVDQGRAPIQTLSAARESVPEVRITPLLQAQPASEPGRKDAQGPASTPLDNQINDFMGHQAKALRRESTRGRNLQVVTPRRTESQTLSSKQPQQNSPGRREEPPADHAIRPADTERAISFQFPKTASAPPPTSTPLPIHVRVGRIEVRGNAPPQAPEQQTSGKIRSIGFASYQRLRRYRI